MGMGGFINLVNGTTSTWRRNSYHSYQMIIWNFPAEIHMICSPFSKLFALLALLLVQMILLEPALASTSIGMPWETPMEKIKNSLTGPVAMVISLLGVTVAGVSLIFGSEFSDFTRRLIMLVLVIGLLVSASTILSTLFGVSGALVR